MENENNYELFLIKKKQAREKKNERQRLNYQKRKEKGTIKRYYIKSGSKPRKELPSKEEYEAICKNKQKKDKRVIIQELEEQIEQLKQIIETQTNNLF